MLNSPPLVPYSLSGGKLLIVDYQVLEEYTTKLQILIKVVEVYMINFTFKVLMD